MMRQAAGKSRQWAFTLVEVLVVIAVMGLLAAAREDARTAQCLSNLRQLGQSVLMYSQDHRGLLPGPIQPLLCQGAYDDSRTAGPYWFDTNLSSFLARSFGDSQGHGFDAVATCPTAVSLGIPRGPDQGRRRPEISAPVFYLANTGAGDCSCCSDVKPYYRTDPPNYFGSPQLGAAAAVMEEEYSLRAPKRLDLIRDTSREWQLADLWHWEFVTMCGRRNVGTWPFLMTGGVGSRGGQPQLTIPSYPFHRTRRSFRSDTALTDRSPDDRLTAGVTNAAYFDGHVACVRRWEGSVNPLFNGKPCGPCGKPVP